jgi:hypothetical protein
MPEALFIFSTDEESKLRVRIEFYTEIFDWVNNVKLNIVDGVTVGACSICLPSKTFLHSLLLSSITQFSAHEIGLVRSR